MSLVKKSFKELNEMTEEVAFRFFAAKKMTIMSKQGEMLAESDLPCLLYMQKVETAYCALDEREKNLINNEFFYQSYQEWWKPLYSKASFYRYKKEAMEKFLGAFYEL